MFVQAGVRLRHQEEGGAEGLSQHGLWPGFSPPGPAFLTPRGKLHTTGGSGQGRGCKEGGEGTSLSPHPIPVIFSVPLPTHPSFLPWGNLLAAPRSPKSLTPVPHLPPRCLPPRSGYQLPAWTIAVASSLVFPSPPANYPSPAFGTRGVPLTCKSYVISSSSTLTQAPTPLGAKAICDKLN